MRKTMYFLMMLITVVMMGAVPAMGAASAFTVAWDPNDPTPDGYALFGRWATQSYDYTAPLWEGTDTMVAFDDILPSLPDMSAPNSVTASWDRDENSITVGWIQPTDPVSEDTFYMVVRAFLNATDNAPRMESVDSEEVSILLENANTLAKWVVSYSDTAGGPYTALDEVVQTGGVDPIVTAPITSVAAGEIKRLYFTVVAFGKNGAFSPNAAETSVLIDRRQVLPPVGISISVIVPVQ